MENMESDVEINEQSHYFSLILGYIHFNCIDFNSTHGVFIPSKVIQHVLQYYRHRFSVYAIGMNKYEEFGDVNMNIRKSHILHNVQYFGFQKCDEFSHLLSSPISDCIYYGRHKFMIKKQNSIFVAGHNNLGQCGVNSKELEIDEFTQLNIPNTSDDYTVTTISSGICSKHSFIITQEQSSNFKIYAFGTNQHGQFGNDTKCIQPQRFPLELSHLSQYLFIDLKLEIVQISCGHKHSIFLSSCGKLLGCGLNDKGQCGLEYDEDYEYILEPEMIEIESKIVEIDCGREHTLCLDENGSIWVFGVNTNGELGIGKNKHEYEWIDQPLCINDVFLPWKSFEIVSISAGERHSLFIDKDYGLWICGSNWYNQIGNGQSFTQCQKVPFLIQSLPKFKDIKIVDASCGDYHTIALCSDNNVYTFGANDSYQCHPPMFNNSDMEKITSPMLIERKHINIGPHDIITRVLGAASATLLIVE